MEVVSLNSSTTVDNITKPTKSGDVKTKTIYITTKAGQAKELQERLASGKPIGIIRKVSGGSPCPDGNKPFNVSNVTVIQRTVSSRTGLPERKVLQRFGCDAKRTQDAVEKVALAESKEIVLQEAPSETNPSTVEMVQSISSHYRGPRAVQFIQRPSGFQQQQQLHPQRQPQANLIRPGARFPVVPRLITVSPGTTRGSEMKQQLKRIPVLATKQSVTEKSPSTTTLLPCNSKPKEEIKPVVTKLPQQSLLTSSLLKESAQSQKTKFPFPMSSLFSLDLKKLGPVVVPIQAIQKPRSRPDPSKKEPVNSSVQIIKNRVKTLLHKRPTVPPRNLGRNTISESWPGEDAPLTALSLQNGLQKALSMTPFSALLDDDAPVKDSAVKDSTVKDSNQPKLQTKNTILPQYTDIARSKKIVDEQVAKVSVTVDTLVTSSDNRSGGSEDTKDSANPDEPSSGNDVFSRSVKIYPTAQSPTNVNDTHEREHFRQTIPDEGDFKLLPLTKHSSVLEVQKTTSQGETEDLENIPVIDETEPQEEGDILKQIFDHIFADNSKLDKDNENGFRTSVINGRPQIQTKLLQGDKYAIERIVKIHRDRQLRDCYRDVLQIWERYLSWGPNVMREFETNNALYHHYTADAYEMVSNPDLSVWGELDDLRYIRNVKTPDLCPDDLLRSI